MPQELKQPTFEELKAKLDRASGTMITAQTYGGVGLVEIHSRQKFDIREHELLLSFDALELIYLAMLQAKQSLRMAQGGAPAPVANPVPGKPS